MKKYKKIKQKIDFVKSDVEFLEDRISKIEADKKNRKEIFRSLVSLTISLFLIILVVAYFYDVFVKI